MTFAAALPWPTQTMYIPEDRSLGTEGEILRKRLDAAAKPPNVDEADVIIGGLLEIVAQADRGEEIWSRVFGALLQTAGGYGATVAVSVWVRLFCVGGPQRADGVLRPAWQELLDPSKAG